jgi:hypothetical protein
MCGARRLQKTQPRIALQMTPQFHRYYLSYIRKIVLFRRKAHLLVIFFPNLKEVVAKRIKVIFPRNPPPAILGP